MGVIVKRKGMLLIISGPSGTGKGTLVQKLMNSDPSIYFSCSVTTRAPRPGEINGIHYRFINNAEYDRMLAGDEFLEHATVHEHRYGTPKLQVEQMLASGKNVLLDIDPQGAISVMGKVRDYVSIFLIPPSFSALRVRLHTRNTDDPVEIERRLRNARQEVLNIDKYQYAVINDDLELAFCQLQCIVNAEKLRTIRYTPTILED
jgi:guanylate kinase